MSKTVQELAREACGCAICKNDIRIDREWKQQQIDRPAEPWKGKGNQLPCVIVANIEHALVEHEKAVREEILQKAKRAQVTDCGCTGGLTTLENVLAEIHVRKPADTEEGA